MRANRSTFLRFSAELTGYNAVALEGTGLVDEYQHLLDSQVGKSIAAQFYATAEGVLGHRGAKARERSMRAEILDSQIFWPLAAALIVLWYQGFWAPLPATWYQDARVKVPKSVTPGGAKIVPSAQAYTQQLAYRAAGAHPPGANPTGFGSWAIPPVFGDDVPDGSKAS